MNAARPEEDVTTKRVEGSTSVLKRFFQMKFSNKYYSINKYFNKKKIFLEFSPKPKTSLTELKPI